MTPKYITATALAALAFAIQAQAAFTYVPTPEGSYAGWDTFTNPASGSPNISITAAAPDISDNTNFTSTLSADMRGSITGGGDRIYNGVAASSAAFDITIDGTASNTINSLVLTLKMSQPNGIDIDDFFSASLNGEPAINGSLLSWVQEELNGEPVGIVTFQWDGLSINPSDDFSINLTSPAAGHASLDVIQLSEAIPEPSAALLSSIAALGLLIRRRR